MKTGTVWLGLKLQCARCHDHKFDPTSNQDYLVYLFQNGGPSHVDLFDYKPRLTELTDGERFSTMTASQTRNFAPEITTFSQHGDCGKWIAGDFLPYKAEIVDKLCFVSSMRRNQLDDLAALNEMNLQRLGDPDPQVNVKGIPESHAPE